MTGVLGKRSIGIRFHRNQPDGKWRILTDVIELDETIVEDPAASDLMARFDRVLGARTRERAAAQKRDPHAVSYLGSQACASCHPAEFEAWSASRHASAWKPLQESRNTLNPLCLQCHTTGYLKPNGFFMDMVQPHLVAVGCETCHGPGERHISDPFRQKLSPGSADACRDCHTPGQTPDFDFARFWLRIQH
jgi:hypothetical protein